MRETMLISLLINLIIIMLVLGVAWWIISIIPLPPPFAMIAQVILVLIALILLIDLLLGVGGWHLLWR